MLKGLPVMMEASTGKPFNILFRIMQHRIKLGKLFVL
jgi:hypothetical protein